MDRSTLNVEKLVLLQTLENKDQAPETYTKKIGRSRHQISLVKGNIITYLHCFILIDNPMQITIVICMPESLGECLWRYQEKALA